LNEKESRAVEETREKVDWNQWFADTNALYNMQIKPFTELTKNFKIQKFKIKIRFPLKLRPFVDSPHYE
jgi:hypothetical protein